MRIRPRPAPFRPSRRDLLRSGVAAGSALALGRAPSAQEHAHEEKLRLGIVGVANRGRANLDAVAGEEIVALCDVDARYLGDALKRFDGARGYADFRRMLEREELDAVVVSTPDHTHAPAASMALERGLHVYCEKPLTHSVAEARRLMLAARPDENGVQRVQTQMGIQIHATENYRRTVWMVQSGAIGPVREVYVWCGKGWWAPSLPEAPRDAAPPEHLDWDLWTGPAKQLAYRDGLHPADWRRYWPFGGGTLADMACHYMDLPFWALGLRAPTDVEAEGPPPSPTGAPEWLHVRWSFPKRTMRPEHRTSSVEVPPVTLHWYDGGRRPPILDEHGIDWGSGVLFVGEQGMLLADYGRRVLLPAEDFTDYAEPDHRGLVLTTEPGPLDGPYPWRTIPYEPREHHAQWLDRCRPRGRSDEDGAPFRYAGALTETVLLGAVAYRAGAKLTWDAATLTATGADADRLAALIDPPAREGWRT